MAKVTILLSHERSGSHLLGEIIASFSGIRTFDEVCNAGAVNPNAHPYSFHRFRRDWTVAHPAESLAQTHQSQTKFVRDYFALLTSLAAGKNVVVDIKYGHIHHFEGMWCPVFRRPFLFTFAESEKISFVHLFRESAVETAISDQVAKARNFWHSWEKAATQAVGKTYKIDPGVVANEAKLLKLQQQWINEHWMGRCAVRQLSYETLVDNLVKGSDFADLATFVGGTPRAQRPELRHKKVTSIADVVENLAEVKAACIAAGLTEKGLLES